MKRIALLSLAVLSLAGCTRWQYTHPLPAPGEAPRTFGAARVTVPAGTMMELRDVEVTPDSVIGWRGERHRGLERVALPRSQVAVFDRRVTDPWRTAGAVVLGVVGAYAAVALYFLDTVEI